MNKSFRDDLIAKGWTVDAAGELHHPSHGGRRVVAGEREQPAGPLVGQAPPVEGRAVGVGGGDVRAGGSGATARGRSAPQLLITLISLRGRRLDGDNLAGGFKPLRDAIAARLGVDDGDGRIEWEYGQVVSSRVETLVVIRSL